MIYSDDTAAWFSKYVCFDGELISDDSDEYFSESEEEETNTFVDEDGVVSCELTEVFSECDF